MISTGPQYYVLGLMKEGEMDKGTRKVLGEERAIFSRPATCD